MHMVNCGLLPPKTDLTPALVGEAGAVRSTGMPLLPFETQVSDAAWIRREFGVGVWA